MRARRPLSRRFVRCPNGSSAVEFALIAPVLIAFLFGIIGFSTVFSIASALQQLAAESARASIAGLSDTERSQIVQNFVTANLAAYPFLARSQLTISSNSISTPTSAYRVSLTYDLSAQIGSQHTGLLPIAVTRLQRSAIVLTSSAL